MKLFDTAADLETEQTWEVACEECGVILTQDDLTFWGPRGGLTCQDCWPTEGPQPAQEENGFETMDDMVAWETRG